MKLRSQRWRVRAEAGVAFRGVVKGGLIVQVGLS